MLGKSEVGSLWFLHTFIPGSHWCIGEVYWVKDAGVMAATEILLCLLFLISDFQGSSESITEEKRSREIACWFESYAQNTVSFEKLEQELGKGVVKKTGKNLLPGDISGISR